MDRLILTGQMRSGTTMLAAFLNAQAGCTVHADTLRVSLAALNVFGPGHDPARVLGGTERKRLFRGLANLVARRKADPGNPGHRLEDGYFARYANSDDRPEFRTEAELYALLLGELAAAAGAGEGTLFGTKVTRAERLAEVLAGQGMKAVVILRDPRAVYLSTCLRSANDPGFNARTEVEGVIAGWRDSFAVWRGGKVLGIRYEDFLDGNAEIARLSAYLDRPLDPDAVIPTSNSSFGDASTGRRRTQARDRWRDHGDPEVMARIAAELGPEMAAAGYL